MGCYTETMAEKDNDERGRREWVAEEQWHIANATTDLSQFMRPLKSQQRAPDARVFTLLGEEASLAGLWQFRPLLLVLGSLSCPPSRLYNVDLNALASDFSDQLNVVVLYVIDAHPDGDLCPYTGTDWLTGDNERDGVRVRQPVSQAERNALATEYRDYLGLEVPILTDNMDNEAWQALGRWPNLAVLIDVSGRILFFQDWLRPEVLREELAAKLSG